jgi:hypothetical protein
MRTKGIGPNNLGAPKGVGKMMKSPAKQTNTSRLDPRQATTQADSLAVETNYMSGNRDLATMAGNLAAGGEVRAGTNKYNFSANSISRGTKPNSDKAKKAKKANRALGAESGLDYRDAYKLSAPNGAGKMMKSPAKQTEDRDHYYDLMPKDARTYADSAAVETRHGYSSVGGSSRRSAGLGEIAGKAASGGQFKQGSFTTGKTPNSSKAKEFLKRQRNTQAGYGVNYKDTYR